MTGWPVWMIFCSVASHGLIDNKRKQELQALMKSAKAGLVYVTAVPDRKTLFKDLNDIA
jgi:adenine-specific DNA-methyltransferase